MKQNELLKNFQTEELEKRFEMGWISSVKVGVSYDQYNLTAEFDVY